MLDQRQLIRAIEGEIAQQTGRHTHIKWEGFEVGDLREILRLLRELADDKRAAVKRAQMTPWRQP